MFEVLIYLKKYKLFYFRNFLNNIGRQLFSQRNFVFLNLAIQKAIYLLAIKSILCLIFGLGTKMPLLLNKALFFLTSKQQTYFVHFNH